MCPLAFFSVVDFDVQTAHVVLREKEELSSCSRAAFLCFPFVILTEDKTQGFILDHCQIHCKKVRVLFQKAYKYLGDTCFRSASALLSNNNYPPEETHRKEGENEDTFGVA